VTTVLKAERLVRVDVHSAEVPVLCLSCEARHKGVCGALSAGQLIELSKHTRRTTLHPNDVFAYEGEALERYANILMGVVKLTKMTRDGRQQIVGLQFAPDLLGRPLNPNTSTTIEAATEVKVCAFPRAIVDKMLASTPELEHRMFLQTAKELEEAHELMLALGRKTALERVASFIWYIGTHIDPEHVGQPVRYFALPLSRTEMADFLGLTLETVSRQITKLRKLEVIRVTNNRDIEVPDMAKLKAVCDTETR
jgi:CRP/FNR family transcriptional regulator, anaerobic regulatory protein